MLVLNMADIKFEDFSKDVINSITDKAIAFLHEACGELQAQVKRNTKRKTGQTAGSWNYNVDESKMEGTVGSPEENAIWEEFGTGDYALNGDGRKQTPWRYQSADGKWHTTHGKHPRQPFIKAKNTVLPKIKKYAEQHFKELGDK